MKSNQLLCGCSLALFAVSPARPAFAETQKEPIAIAKGLPTDEQIATCFPLDTKQTIPWLTEANRPYVIERIKAKRDAEGSNPETTRNILLALNDPEVVAEECKRYHLHQANDLETYGREAAITALAPDLFVDPKVLYTKENSAYHESDFPLQNMTTRKILQCIRNTPSFPKATRDWANIMDWQSADLKFPRVIRLTQQWWEHNKEAMIAKRYAEATWVPEREPEDYETRKQILRSWLENEAARKRFEAEGKMKKRPVEPAPPEDLYLVLSEPPQPAPPHPQPPNESPPPQKVSPATWPWLVAVGVVLAALWFTLRSTAGLRK
jgi:hypothetical protein